MLEGSLHRENSLTYLSAYPLTHVDKVLELEQVLFQCFHTLIGLIYGKGLVYEEPTTSQSGIEWKLQVVIPRNSYRVDQLRIFQIVLCQQKSGRMLI